MISADRRVHTTTGEISEAKLWFLTLLISSVVVTGFCVYYANSQSGNQESSNVSPSKIIDVSDQMQAGWQPDPNNYLDQRIIEMDKIEPFIGVGRGK